MLDLFLGFILSIVCFMNMFVFLCFLFVIFSTFPFTLPFTAFYASFYSFFLFLIFCSSSSASFFSCCLFSLLPLILFSVSIVIWSPLWLVTSHFRSLVARRRRPSHHARPRFPQFVGRIESATRFRDVDPEFWRTFNSRLVELDIPLREGMRTTCALRNASSQPTDGGRSIFRRASAERIWFFTRLVAASP